MPIGQQVKCQITGQEVDKTNAIQAESIRPVLLALMDARDRLRRA